MIRTTQIKQLLYTTASDQKIISSEIRPIQKSLQASIIARLLRLSAANAPQGFWFQACSWFSSILLFFTFEAGNLISLLQGWQSRGKLRPIPIPNKYCVRANSFELPIHQQQFRLLRITRRCAK